jgi:hypothetical protein
VKMMCMELTLTITSWKLLRGKRLLVPCYCFMDDLMFMPISDLTWFRLKRTGSMMTLHVMCMLPWSPTPSQHPPPPRTTPFVIKMSIPTLPLLHKQHPPILLVVFLLVDKSRPLPTHGISVRQLHRVPNLYRGRAVVIPRVPPMGVGIHPPRVVHRIL